MKIYSHRGNMHGASGDENSPDYILAAINSGFRVEVDVRVINGAIWLGHDEPQYEVRPTWLYQHSDNLLLHLKNTDALSLWTSHHCFCHVSDPFAPTSRSLVWLHDLARLSCLSQSSKQKTIIPLITEEQLLQVLCNDACDVYGVCSDYPFRAKEICSTFAHGT